MDVAVTIMYAGRTIMENGREKVRKGFVILGKVAHISIGTRVLWIHIGACTHINQIHKAYVMV